VIESWLSIAEEVEPSGTVSPWEVVAEKLQDRVSMVSVYTDKEGLIRSGLFQEESILWISNTLILDILRQLGKDGDSAGFSRYLKQAGHLVHVSKNFRIGRAQRHAWGFSPDFRPEGGITEFTALSEVEERS